MIKGLFLVLRLLRRYFKTVGVSMAILFGPASLSANDPSITQMLRCRISALLDFIDEFFKFNLLVNLLTDSYKKEKRNERNHLVMAVVIKELVCYYFSWNWAFI